MFISLILHLSGCSGKKLDCFQTFFISLASILQQQQKSMEQHCKLFSLLLAGLPRAVTAGIANVLTYG